MRALSLSLLLATSALFGCQATLPTDRTPGPMPEGNAALIEYIAQLPYVTAEPGYRAVHILWKQSEFQGDFQALQQTLRAGEIIGDWDHQPDSILMRGDVGYMLCRALEIKSGLNWVLTGLGRYAWRELNYLGIASPLSETGYVPGGQFLGFLSRAEDFRDNRRASLTQRAQIGSEMNQ